MSDFGTIQIRKATMEDISSVACIYEKIHIKEQKKEVQIGWLPGVYPVEDTARSAGKRQELFVMEDQGRVLASAIINQIQVDSYAGGNWRYPAEEQQVMVLHTLVVDPEVSGRGIGSQFVRFYEDYARENNCLVLRMDTNEKNIAARSLYKKLGYREAGVVPCEFNGIPGVNLVLLEKSLNKGTE